MKKGRLDKKKKGRKRKRGGGRGREERKITD